MSTFRFIMRFLTVPVMVGLASSGLARETFIDGNLTPQSRVLALDSHDSAKLFDTVDNIDSLGDDAFELVIKSPPSFLEPLAVGWRLVAATDAPLHPLGQAEGQLVDSGLLAHVAATDTDEDGTLRLSIESAELGDVVEDGTLTIIVVERVTSEEDDFPVESLLGKAPSATGRWLLTTFQDRSWEPCPPEDTSFEHEKTLYFTPQASAAIRLQATFALKRQMTFEGGRLKEAKLEGRMCQGTEITPSFEEKLQRDETIWLRQQGPFYRMVGWLPIMFTVNARLNALLSTSGRLSISEPIQLHYDSAGALQLQNGKWQPQPRHSQHQGPELPSLMLNSSLNASFALEPRLELILYGTGGPYLEANATTSAVWKPGQQIDSDLSLTLLGGLTYRNSLWSDDWRDEELKPALYLWPEE
ncbi:MULTISPECIES: hypothetical protein [unclassified Halomonas]|uniref:hypothetical protein n=1 Tax=unclassified Halomonas TaxID=2609666 RepID=UPI0006DB6DDB|nr:MULTISPECIES: hypothetical protein [unclassified Halomonas]KPQ24669.1 MAG: hypothetical protein HLUCCO06_08250 [Halomonas sp. HL-93]SBR48703.1 hypothetical protein GA0071314_1833 [Halomonas sp. HL-93]SNY96148.1 hypothetical protein SAMN04488142_0675 [Halomonas sp. hl-4]